MSARGMGRARGEVTRRVRGRLHEAIAVLGAAALVTAAACSLAVDLDGLAGGPDGSGSGGGGGSGGASVCARPLIPEPPGSPDDGGEIEMTSAVRSMNLGENAKPEEPVGLDIDKHCTCLGDGPSCTLPAYAKSDQCDAVGGVDNGAAKVFKALLATVSDNQGGVGSKFFSKSADAGSWSILLRVTGYNGGTFDSRVTLSIYLSPGLTSSEGSGSGGAGGGGDEAAPEWNGEDAWPVSSSSLVDGASLSSPKFTDPNAYVAEGMLVASLPELHFNFRGVGSNLDLRVSGATILGRIEDSQEDQLGLRLAEGVITGRWKVSDVFQSVSTFRANGAGVCNDGGIAFNQVKKLLCNNVDSATAPGSVTIECDALSFGMSYKALPAKLGPIYVSPVGTSTCPPEQDPALATCDP